MNSVSGSSSSQNVYEGYGFDVAIPVTTDKTTQAMQDAWDKQMEIIYEIVGKMNTDPSTAEGDDLYRLLDALKALENLAKNGITADGETSFLTTRMAQALGVMLAEFAQVGITPNLAQPQADPMSILSAASKPGVDPYSDPLQVAVIGAAGLTYENLGLQSYLYAVIMNQVLPVYNGKFEELYNYMELTEKTLSTIDTLKKITTYVEMPTPSGYNMELNSAADIPPEAVDAIDKYMRENNPNDFEIGFKERYNNEKTWATEAAKKNGTTFEEEMAKYNGPNSSAARLKSFVGWDGDPQRAADIANIMASTQVVEVEGIPTAPPGMTMSEVGQQIWDSKKEIDGVIEELTKQGADPKLIDSLKTVSNDIQGVWEKAIADYNTKNSPPIPITATPDSLITSNPTAYSKLMDGLATKFIASSGETQTGGSIYSHLDESLKRFQTLDEDQQKEFKKLMTTMDQLLKMVGMMMKALDDAYKKIISGYRA